jgi:hypothetical protein
MTEVDGDVRLLHMAVCWQSIDWSTASTPSKRAASCTGAACVQSSWQQQLNQNFESKYPSKAEFRPHVEHASCPPWRSTAQQGRAALDVVASPNHHMN